MICIYIYTYYFYIVYRQLHTCISPREYHHFCASVSTDFSDFSIAVQDREEWRMALVLLQRMRREKIQVERFAKKWVESSDQPERRVFSRRVGALDMFGLPMKNSSFHSGKKKW